MPPGDFEQFSGLSATTDGKGSIPKNDKSLKLASYELKMLWIYEKKNI